MTQLLRLFFDICLFRRGPQDVPASVWLLRAVLALYLVLGIVLLTLDGGPVWRSVAKALIDLALLGGITWGALSWRRYQARFAQTMTALLGTGVILSVIALPVVRWLYLSTTAGGPDPLAAMIWFALLLWSLAVMGHVMRHALQGTFALGMLFAVTYLVAQITLLDLLFQRPG